MDNKKKIDTEQIEIDRLYLGYFTPQNDEDENTSLVQPSPFKWVDTFTSDGVTEKPPIHVK